MEPRTKHCPFCDEEIKYSARKCKHCGEFLDEDLYQQNLEDQKYIYQKSSKNWSPGIAAVLSLFIPGAGQMYKGQIGNGIGWLIFISAGYFFSFVLTAMIITAILTPFALVGTLLLHLLCIYYAATRPIPGGPIKKVYKKDNDKGIIDLDSLKPFLIIIGLVIIAVIAGKIDEKGITGLFNSSDDSTEMPVDGPDQFEYFTYDVVYQHNINYYITIDILDKDKIDLETATQKVFEKENQLFNIHVFESAAAANLYVEYFDKRNNITSESDPTKIPEKIKDVDKKYIPQLKDTYLGMIDFDTKTFWDHPLKTSE